MITQKRAQLALTLWWIAIFSATTIPGHSLPKSDIIGIDKLVHLVMYGGLSFWLFWFFYLKESKWIFLKVLGIAVIYSFVDEWHQPFIGRTFSLLDVAANMIGALTVLASLSLFVKFRGKHGN